MFSRRKFINKSFLGSFALLFSGTESCKGENIINQPGLVKPSVIATWKNEEATQKAWEIIQKGGSALDAVEQGVRIVEADPDDMSVGYGGRPDRDGHVTLDACIMDSKGNAGSVCFLQHIKHPISVARKVMEETPHVILAGAGALKFALGQGFKKENLLTDKSLKEWKEWMKTSDYQPVINIENHDTIGMVAMDQNGDMAGACTTSGLSYKIHGRVGDSPIIGAGLFVDNEVGAVTSTGMGEAVLKSLGSFLVVELMRQGRTPQEACEEAVMRIVKKQSHKNIQVGYLAMNKAGEYGAFAIQAGFNYAVQSDSYKSIKDAQSYLK